MCSSRNMMIHKKYLGIGPNYITYDVLCYFLPQWSSWANVCSHGFMWNGECSSFNEFFYCCSLKCHHSNPEITFLYNCSHKCFCGESSYVFCQHNDRMFTVSTNDKLHVLMFNISIKWTQATSCLHPVDLSWLQSIYLWLGSGITALGLNQGKTEAWVNRQKHV